MSNFGGLGLLCTAGLAIVVAGPSGCHCGSDAERAAAEREKIRKKVESAYTLVPYRALKVLSRATGANDRTPELQALVERLPGPEKLPRSIEGASDARQAAGVVLEVAVILFEARGELAKHDEDHYPLLWSAWTKRSPPMTWYGNEAEHLALATAWTVGELVDQSRQTPTLEFAFYELSRAEPKEDWPLPVKLWGRLARGVSFCGAGDHFAAEEELTRYIEIADGLKPERGAELRIEGLDSVPMVEIAQAAGHIARAWNRLGLNREKRAADDLEAGLASLTKAGVDNELTQWAWAVLHYYRKKPDEAAKDLEKLAQSPYLDEKTRTEIRTAAASIRGQRPGIFGSVRAGAIIGGALVARAGGGARILATLFGEETATQVQQPLTWLSQMREGLGKYATGDAITGALREKARESGAKGLDLLKQRVTEVKAAVGADKPAPAAEQHN
ncbi:MAG: hypothetical protein HY901_07480 [Deltaproteobacteria bacterium]|nr:hypothetical protein [Deltaproteobacteria bacterium]